MFSTKALRGYKVLFQAQARLYLSGVTSVWLELKSVATTACYGYKWWLLKLKRPQGGALGYTDAWPHTLEDASVCLCRLNIAQTVVKTL